MTSPWLVSASTAAQTTPLLPFSTLLCCHSSLRKARKANWIKPPILRSTRLLQRHARLALSRAEEHELPSEVEEEEDREDLPKSVLVWRAVKLPIYSVALVPLTVGSCAAYLQSGVFLGKRYLMLLGASVLIIAWLNLSNDVYDSITGVDKQKKESVVNMTGSREWVLAAANVSLVLGLAGLVKACIESGDIRSIFLLGFSIFCGYIYQCPPFRLGYKGLGEPLCFAAFGPFATSAFSLSMGGILSGSVLSASLLVGITTTLILFCSHFHQIEGDLAVGKMSPLVRIGTLTGSKVVMVAVYLLYFLLIVFCIGKALPPSCVFLGAFSLPVGKLVADFVNENHDDKVRIFMGKYFCVRLHIMFGTLLALGLVLARRPWDFRFPFPS
ncbi:ubiA prenyltransferase family protein [Wolffia australiana]